MITGPAVTDLDLNKEMDIFGNSDREIHKIFIFLLLVVTSTMIETPRGTRRRNKR